jgi:glucose-6-phosphate 1-dehydrogenase
MFERFIIFGASGDLTARLLLPGLAHLLGESLMGGRLSVVGVGREAWTTEQFRARMRLALAKHAADTEASVREKLVGILEYRRADVTRPDEVSPIIHESRAPLLAYLALPPGLFDPALRSLASAGLPGASAVAIEKPFGEDTKSAHHLNRLLAEQLPSASIFRIDHFLSNDLVTNIFTLRAANRIFEPILNSQHVARVEIIWDEILALEGRAGYYDRAGALRDMLQNHLLQVMCLLAMELPTRMEERAVRDARAAVLCAISTPAREEIRRHSVRARYSAGKIGDRAIPAYRDEPGVDPDRCTETFAELTLELPNWRWQGVPFILRSGKAMGQNRAELLVHFRDVPGRPDRRPVEPNVLRIGLHEPCLYAEVNVLSSGRQLRRSQLTLSSAEPQRPPYANVLLDMMNNDPTLSVRGDEAEEAWRIMEPVITAWAKDEVPLQEYPAGSEGPAERLIR